MKLSELVALKNLLKKVSTIELAEQTDKFDAGISAVSLMPMHADYRDHLLTILKNVSKIEDHINTINGLIPKIIDNIDYEIKEKTKDYRQRGYLINGFYGSNSTDTYTERTDRIMPVSDSTRADIINLIRQKTGWHYPVLEIGPGDGVWTEYLVAGDPLYLVDINPEFLESTMSRFNEVYQRRIRSYLTGGWVQKNEFDLGHLPKNQFGFIFSWNVFNYFPEVETEIMLKQIFHLLRPGGSIIFSYNDCNLVQCAEYAENGFRSWITQEKIFEISNRIGFNVVRNDTPEETFSWVELCKPGELTTVKAHQVLGKIIDCKS